MCMLGGSLNHQPIGSIGISENEPISTLQKIRVPFSFSVIASPPLPLISINMQAIRLSLAFETKPLRAVRGAVRHLQSAMQAP